MLARCACVLGLLGFSLGCSANDPPSTTPSGGSGGSSSGGTSGTTAGATSSGGAGAGGTGHAGSSSGGTGAVAGAGSGGAAAGTAGSSTTGGSGGAPQGGTQSEGGAGGGSLPEELEIASKQKAPTGIAIDAQFVYWGNRDAGTIVKCPLDGCGGKAPTVVASNIGKPMGVTVGGDILYWMASPVGTSSNAQVLKCPISGCTGVPERLFQFAVENRAVGVRAKGDTVYYAAWPQLGSCAVSGCDDKPTAFMRMPALGVDANDELLFVARYNGLVSCSLDGCNDQKSLSSRGSLSVSVDGTHVYFTSYDYLGEDSTTVPGIWRCPLAGCGADEPETIRDGDIAPFGIAVNETRLFYTDTEAGTVMSLAKPGN